MGPQPPTIACGSRVSVALSEHNPCVTCSLLPCPCAILRNFDGVPGYGPSEVCSCSTGRRSALQALFLGPSVRWVLESLVSFSLNLAMLVHDGGVAGDSCGQ